MDIKQIFYTIYGFIVSALGVMWWVISTLHSLPFYVGYIALIAFWIWLVRRYRRYIPQRIRSHVRNILRPIFWTGTTPLRWQFVKRIANPEWLRGPNDAKPHIVEVEKIVYVRHTVGEWFKSTIWKVALGAATVIAIQNWGTLYQIFSQ